MRPSRSGSSPILWASLLLLAPSLSPATAQLLGPEFQVNSYTTSGQHRPAVAANGSGNFVVAWQSYAQDGSADGSGVFGQRYDPAGNPVGNEFQVNSYTTSSQTFPAVAVDGSGNVVVIWQSVVLQDGSIYDLFGQRFDSAGAPVGSEFQVNTYTEKQQEDPAVAADGAGNFLVVWESYGQDGSSRGVFGQRFDAAGNPAGNEFQVNTYTTGNQQDPAVAADSSGDFVVVWTGSGEQDGFNAGVFGQRFDPLGTKVGSEFQVNSFTRFDQWAPTIATDGSGNFVVAWQSYSNSPSINDLFAQRYDSAGNPAGSEFPVNSYTEGFQRDSSIAADSAGNFVVVWWSEDQDGSEAGVFAQRYEPAGNPVGSEIQVNSYTTGYQYQPAVAVDGAGNALVVWASYEPCEAVPCPGQDGSSSGVFGRRLTLPLFSDDFESGDGCAWSDQVGSGDLCS